MVLIKNICHYNKKKDMNALTFQTLDGTVVPW